ncbi:MAG TPA: mechanosensitive ion channel domain-containing protein [Gemmataceae bacterium]
MSLPTPPTGPLLAEALIEVLDRLWPWAAGHADPLFGLSGTQWLGLTALLLFGFALGYLLQWLMFYCIRPKAEVDHDDWQESLLKLIPRPLRITAALLVLRLGAEELGLTEEQAVKLTMLVQILLIATLTWLALRTLTVGSQFLEAYLTRRAESAAERRAIHTQIAVPRGILRALLIFVGLALILLQFEVVRNIGLSLLASAGVAGIIIGFAAQRTVANILAGIQLAVFQPIKIGDVVVVENEWGIVEEINLTYVVVRIWDLRRLILPVNYFIERPFQNWTRKTSEVMGTVFLQADYTVPVGEIREELKKILRETDLWDGKVEGLVVTDLKNDTVELRALVSAEDGGKLWNLRCFVRERLLGWMQQRARQHLPRRRLELLSGAADGGGEAPPAEGGGKPAGRGKKG